MSTTLQPKIYLDYLFPNLSLGNCNEQCSGLFMSSNSWKHKILSIKCNEQAHTNCTKIWVWFLFWQHLDFTSDDWSALYLKFQTIQTHTHYKKSKL